MGDQVRLGPSFLNYPLRVDPPFTHYNQSLLSWKAGCVQVFLSPVLVYVWNCCLDPDPLIYYRLCVRVLHVSQK